MTEFIPLFVYVFYAILERIAFTHMGEVENKSPHDLSPIDKKMWKQSPASNIHAGIVLTSKFVKWIFLILYGIHYIWWYALITFFIAIPICEVIKKIFQGGDNLGRATTLILPALPILLIALFATLRCVT